ncbi:ER degradation-enhancing alpha-mannosidase-like protein 2 [Drosophila subpulchrella]|uniref:ER degradation-enhancing alpha-mannosidase-like protein 2 n=1 Tax=Drosophila subpulchrella TaxID=1486046 RepID=UPI0018A1671E|nr:ER degradation-enhancing alpha-mannosidase-like protein 2 [Drosophila subpulchrella]
MQQQMTPILTCAVLLLLATGASCQKQYSKARKLELREDVRRMFQHAYEGYLRHASNYDELRPLTCDGHDTWGSYSLTLIDALDTLATMGNFTEFRRVTRLLEEKMNFDRDINVSVFETNIRIVGGLLSAHLLSKRAGLELEQGWPCKGPLLRLAEDVARRLLPAFDTNTGMPYGTVNLRYGVPKGETSVTCTAGVGTFLIEFGTLSRLTGNSIYEEVAMQAVYALWGYRSPIGLFGNHIDVQSGRWTALDSGIGAGVDSLFEYLVKASVLLNRPELLDLFHEARAAIDKYMRKEDWYVWVGMNKGHVTLPVFQSLEAFWPGILSIIGDTEPALRTISRYIGVWKKYGFLPEFYNIAAGEASPNREVYPLRPELIESAMYLYRATGNEYLLELGEHMLETLEFSAKTKCGYATIRNVVTHEKENRMESFFLAETSKYLYLLFDEDNFLHNDGSGGELLSTEDDVCVVQAGAYIFNTEAHPMDMSALHCCHAHKEDIYASLDLQRFSPRAIFERSRERQVAVQDQWVPQCHPENYEYYYKEQDNVQAKESGREQGREQAGATTTMAVDIEVFDEFQQPAGDLLVSNFERIREERELNESLQRSEVPRNQLTVSDLDEFFAQRRENFGSASEALKYVLAFMGNYTMDVAFIRGLQLYNANISSVLGTGAQKEYESRMRSLWQLYELEQQYVANVRLIQGLGLLTLQVDGEQMRSYLVEVLDSLDRPATLEEQDPQDFQPKSSANASSPQLSNIREVIVKARNAYAIALVNTTAMQEFAIRIYLSGTSEGGVRIHPLLEPAELSRDELMKPHKLAEERTLFSYARRIVDFRKRMAETVGRLQTLMQDIPPDKSKEGSDDSQATKADAATVYAQTEAKVAEAKAQQHDQKLETRQPTQMQKEKPTEDGSGSGSGQEESGSVWSQFVQTILRKTTVQRVKFDEAVLLEKTRKALEKHAHKEQPHHLFACQRPEYIEGFAYRDFYPEAL